MVEANERDLKELMQLGRADGKRAEPDNFEMSTDDETIQNTCLTIKHLKSSGSGPSNVRRSSVFTSKHSRGINTKLSTARSRKTRPNQVATELAEKEILFKHQSLNVPSTQVDKPKNRKRMMRENKINSTKLTATVRRLQQRRFRPPKNTASAKYIQNFLAILYYIGMSPFQPKSAGRLPKWCLRFQRLLYWTFALISILNAADGMKYGWIQFRVEENMLNFITFGYMFANCITRLYYIKVFATSSEETKNILKQVELANNVERAREGADWSMWVAGTIVGLSVLFSLSSAIMGTSPLPDWTMRNAILSRSYEFSEFISIWTSHNWNNETDKLIQAYGTDVTGTVVAFATLGNFLDYFGTLHSCVLLDVWPILAIQICHLQIQLSKKIQGATTRESCSISLYWEDYLQLRNICNQIDAVFGMQVKLIHMQNMLLFGYFLLELLKKEPISTPLLIEMITVLKVLITYYIAQKVADENEGYQNCVTKCSRLGATAEINGLMVSVPVLLREMDKYPIGIGRGAFFVDNAFVLKFAGFVGSIFVLMSGESGEGCQLAAA